jgi:hypothetical protein
MPSRPKSPKDIVKVRRLTSPAKTLPAAGETILVPLEVMRSGPISEGGHDTFTVRVPGSGQLVTVRAEYLLGEVED